VAVLYICLMGCIFRSDSCYLHQNRFPDRSLCCIDDTVFVFAAVIVLVAAVVDLSVPDSHVVH
jgi:hypothetical protein